MRVPTDAKERKGLPLFSGCVAYFPDALIAVAELSRIGNDQHNPGKPLHWDRTKSQDELDALMRHLVDCGTVDTDGVRHSTKVAWRALANLQKELEKEIENAREPTNTASDGSDAGATPCDNTDDAGGCGSCEAGTECIADVRENTGGPR